MRSANRVFTTVLLVAFPIPLAAQSITTEPVTAVPVSNPWLLLALWLTLLAGGAWMLRSRRPQAQALLVAGIAAAGLWMLQPAGAQVLLEFGDPEGETASIPINQILSGSDIQGFQRVTFQNTSGSTLRIASIVEPDFDACFPTGLDEPLPPPAGWSGTECAVGLTIDPGDSCTVDVDALCRERVAEATAAIDVTPSPMSFIEGGTGVLTVTTDAGSPVPALAPAATIPGGSGLTVQSTTCGASLARGASCQITLTAPAVESTSVTIAGTNTAATPVTVNVTATPLATLSVTPSALAFAENATGGVTVTNTSVSVTASNVVATIPGGSNLSVQSTTCGAALAPGASCTITFTSATQEGPTTVSIAGDNTNTATVALTVTSPPMIAITGPVQQSRVIGVGGTALSLEITNDAGSAVNATGITVTNKAAAPNVVVDDSDCLSVAPGASCTLELSSATPYAPATLTIGGTNASNSPTTLVAFSHLGGLVFEESAGLGKVVIDVAQELTSSWASGLGGIAGASSLDDGVANTNAIVADAVCSGDPANCAAQRCRDIGADWYLPARSELTAIQSALCSNGTVPCNAGGFSSASYWSSTQATSGDAWIVIFPSGITGTGTKPVPRPVRCVRPF